MKIKILKIEEKEVTDNINNIHIAYSDNKCLSEVNENDKIKPERFYYKEKIYYKKYYVMNNKRLEIFPSCEITDFLLQLHEDMNTEVNNLYNKNIDLKLGIDKLKKSFWKRLIFLFKKEIK